MGNNNNNNGVRVSVAPRLRVKDNPYIIENTPGQPPMLRDPRNDPRKMVLQKRRHSADKLSSNGRNNGHMKSPVHDVQAKLRQLEQKLAEHRRDMVRITHVHSLFVCVFVCYSRGGVSIPGGTNCTI